MGDPSQGPGTWLTPAGSEGFPLVSGDAGLTQHFCQKIGAKVTPMRIRNRDRGQINAASIRLARRRKDRRNQPSEGGDQLPPLDGAAFKYSVSISVVKYHPIRVQARTLERNTATAKAADKVGVGTARPHIWPPPRPTGPSGLPSGDLPPVPGLQAGAPPGAAFAHVPTLSTALRNHFNQVALCSRSRGTATRIVCIQVGHMHPIFFLASTCRMVYGCWTKPGRLLSWPSISFWVS